MIPRVTSSREAHAVVRTNHTPALAIDSRARSRHGVRVSDQSRNRIPIRAAFAFAGGGSLGTFLSGAVRELVLAIRQHNAAIIDDAPDDDPRLINAGWGRIVIDAIGGSSAGALVASQLVKCLFDPAYLGDGHSMAQPQTLTGDWIHGGNFEKLAVEGNSPGKSGPVEAPGWTLISGAKLFELARSALTPGTPPADDPSSPLDPTGVVGIAITLTDLLGYHEPAEFEIDRVLGHPSFGAGHPTPARMRRYAGRQVKDLGGRGHAETRKLFIGRDRDAADSAKAFVRRTNRRGIARGLRWSPRAAERLAGLVAASASLPVAVGPVALTDRAADAESIYRRLYMDGGLLNNKPISPALLLSRWHDGMRVMNAQHDDGTFDLKQVENELVYKRVCFFIDAFPDRAVGEWRSPHPEEVHGGTGAYDLTPAAVAARNKRINDALEAPHAALDVLFESMMSSLRAQDILGIAKGNWRLAQRDAYIDARCEEGPRQSDGTFRIDSVERAQAYASLVAREAAAGLDDAQRMHMAQRIWESDQFSGLTGHRSVTMIPVFAPTNLKAVFAGEALYALGGLLGYEARKHDASVGALIARSVLDSLDGRATHPEVELRHAPHAALPDDTEPVVERLKVTGAALIDGIQSRPTAVRYLAKLPLTLSPITRLAKGWLDRHVLGIPEED